MKYELPVVADLITESGEVLKAVPFKIVMGNKEIALAAVLAASVSYTGYSIGKKVYNHFTKKEEAK